MNFSDRGRTAAGEPRGGEGEWGWTRGKEVCGGGGGMLLEVGEPQESPMQEPRREEEGIGGSELADRRRRAPWRSQEPRRHKVRDQGT